MENVLPRKIRCLRKQAGLTQEDVAKRLDIRRQTYCNYENGSRSLPIETIVLLSDYFHVSVDYLVKEGVPLSPPPSPGNEDVYKRQDMNFDCLIKFCYSSLFCQADRFIYIIEGSAVDCLSCLCIFLTSLHIK